MFKKILIFIFFLNLSNCGFEVIYRDDNSKHDKNYYISELASIRIKKNRTKIDQELKNNLYDLLNPDYIKSEPKYLLILKVTKASFPTFITESGASGRNKVILTVNYELKRLSDAKTISNGSTFVNDNYDVSSNRYGTYISDENIQANLTKVAAQNIRNSLVNDFIEMRKEEEKRRIRKKI